MFNVRSLMTFYERPSYKRKTGVLKTRPPERALSVRFAKKKKEKKKQKTKKNKHHFNVWVVIQACFSPVHHFFSPCLVSSFRNNRIFTFVMK